MTHSLNIWQITDGKRGHENQSIGLIEAIARIHPITTEVLSIEDNRASWWQALRGQYSFKPSDLTPDLVIGTGSQTHSTLLAAARATGAKAIVLMAPARPLLPWFDLCVPPQHDGLKRSNVISTLGALNRIQPGLNQSPHRGLILIGGPSSHHGWNNQDLLERLEGILKTSPQTHWTLTTSRRTPTETTHNLEQLRYSNLDVVPFEKTTPAWLPEQFDASGLVWVTEDSVSMVYEALSSGAGVGLLPVPCSNPKSRVIKGLNQLIADALVIQHSANADTLSVRSQASPLQEADRVAKLVLERFLS